MCVLHPFNDPIGSLFFLFRFITFTLFYNTLFNLKIKTMKNFLLKAFMLLCLILWGGVSSAWAESVEVSSFSDISGDLNSYISYEAAKGNAGTAPAVNAEEIRVYQNGGLFTVSANNGATITEVILGSSMATTVTYAIDGGAASSDQSIAANGKLTVSSISGAEKVVFTCTGTDKNSRLYVNYLKVTYTVPTAEPHTVTFNAGVNGTCSTTSLTESATGAGITLPAATPNTGYDFVGWSTDATPTSANAGAAGETYHPLSNCDLFAYYTVVRPAGEVFYESFDTNNGTGGNDDQWNGSIASNKISSDNENWKFVSGSGANKCAKFGAGSALGSATTPAIAASGYFTLTFKAAAWDGSSESTTLKLSATGATLSESSVTLTKGAWVTYTVNIKNATEGFKIKFEGNKASNSRFFLDEVSIVEAAAPTSTDVTISAAGYATFFDSEHAVTLPEGVTGYAFTAANGLEEYYDAGDVVPAGEPLVLGGAANTYTLNYTTTEDPTLKDNDMNDLEGTDEETALTPDDNCYFYGLSLNAEGETASVGFYWMNETGAAFTNGAHKAYLKLPKNAGARSGFAFNEDTEALESIEMNAATTIYTLSGVKVNELQKGLNIVNGKKVMVK